MKELLLSELNGRLWHATNSTAFRSILLDQEIKHDAKAAYENGFCRTIGAVSLFDLSYPDPEPPISHWSQWISRKSDKPSYWLELSRQRVSDNLIPPPDLLSRWKSDPAYLQTRIIAGIEAGHLGSIELDHVARVLEVSSSNWKELEQPWRCQTT